MLEGIGGGGGFGGRQFDGIVFEGAIGEEGGAALKEKKENKER